MPPFTVRPFHAVVDTFREFAPDIREQAPQHYDAATAFSAEDLGEWPSNPPLPSLYLMKAQRREDVPANAADLMEYANFGSAIGTWNARGTANFATAPGAWIIAEVSLVQEQAEDMDYGDDDEAPGNDVDLLLALWRVEEGWAAAVWRSGEHDTLQRLIGLPVWPSLDQRCEVWYGE